MHSLMGVQNHIVCYKDLVNATVTHVAVVGSTTSLASVDCTDVIHGTNQWIKSFQAERNGPRPRAMSRCTRL